MLSRTIAAGLKVWRASQWMGVLAMGSVKTEALLGVMTGAVVGRVKGPICDGFRGGLAAARRMRRVIFQWGMGGSVSLIGRTDAGLVC